MAMLQRCAQVCIRLARRGRLDLQQVLRNIADAEQSLDFALQQRIHALRAHRLHVPQRFDLAALRQLKPAPQQQQQQHDGQQERHHDKAMRPAGKQLPGLRGQAVERGKASGSDGGSPVYSKVISSLPNVDFSGSCVDASISIGSAAGSAVASSTRLSTSELRMPATAL